MTFCMHVLRAWLNKAFRVVEDEVRQTPPHHGLSNSTNGGGSRKLFATLGPKKESLTPGGLTARFARASFLMFFGLEHFHQRLLQNEDAPPDSYCRQLAGLHHPICGRSTNAYKARGVLNGQRQCFVFMVFFGHGHTLTNEKALSYIYMSSPRRSIRSASWQRRVVRSAVRPTSRGETHATSNVRPPSFCHVFQTDEHKGNKPLRV